MPRTLARFLKGFSLVELLVVIAIIAILAALSFPAFLSARHKAKLTACQTQLYQASMGQHGLDPRVQCPYPESDDPMYVSQYAQWTGLTPGSDGKVEPPPDAAIVFCPNHLKRSGYLLKLPLQGQVPVVQAGSGVRLVDAKGLKRYRLVDKKWTEIPEDGTVPAYPEMWRFPRDPWEPPIPTEPTAVPEHLKPDLL